jgi:transcriptional regulator with XRE-family HTH domain
MEKSLNLPVIKEKLVELGISQSEVAGRLGLTRAAVSKWFTGKAFPRPAELLKFGKMLELAYKDLVRIEVAPPAPLVAFRKRANTKTTDVHVHRAEEMGRALEDLVPYLPFDAFQTAPRLKNPSSNYGYLQKLVSRIRGELGIDSTGPVDFRDLIGKFNELQAVLVPVMWGRQQRHENALHIYLPTSKTTWIFLNLDSEAHDFKFWMAHELGHVLSVGLLEAGATEAAEDFADAFAGALLFPEAAAAPAYAEYQRKKSDMSRIQDLVRVGDNYLISPFSVYKEIEKYAGENALEFTPVPQTLLHAEITKLHKKYPTISESLFDGDRPSADRYMRLVDENFDTPIFKVLGEYVRDHHPSEAIISQMLDIPLIDAREIKRAML